MARHLAGLPRRRAGVPGFVLNGSVTIPSVSFSYGGMAFGGSAFIIISSAPMNVPKIGVVQYINATVVGTATVDGAGLDSSVGVSLQITGRAGEP
jgi:hypothetical protein